MKIVVIGGRGLIGAKVVKILQGLGHEAVSASPSSGVDATTGKGVKEILKGAHVVVDVSNSPSFDEAASMEFFEQSSHHLLPAEKEAGIKHHVVLSVVGTQKMADAGYFRAKDRQEQLIKASQIPYTIVQSTQFYEFLNSIAQSATEEKLVRLPPVAFQPIAADDVASIVAEIAVGPALNGTIEIAGPKRVSFPDLIRDYLAAIQDTRLVTADPEASYFGVAVRQDTLVPEKIPRKGSIALEDWLEHQENRH